ncbi:glycosyltransferase family protein [Sulfitobacter aestuarii]|uniref:Glycosyltransferase family protein n=1 Tax=Sulfitobacter aestuarii TaxID=2161676 RepID=A0ABW5U416_9RHOB
MKILIVVTHLLGSGHLSRALILARAFNAAGWQVTLASGGMPAPLLDRGDVPLLQLPPLRANGVDFSQLLDAEGKPADGRLIAARCAALSEAVNALRPDVLLTELFPFGRRGLRDEFIALLEAAQALPRPPLVCASIRDILAPPGKPKKAAFAEEMLARFYDAVLVHSDPHITTLDRSWPVSAALAEKLHYTGFVAPKPMRPHPQGIGTGEVLVSAGGGDVGKALFATALEAAARDGSRRWRLLLGGAGAADRAAAVTAPQNAIVEPARPDFRQMLPHAAASVSLCGYNTAMDVLQSGVPAVFVPFDEGNEVEQGLRAEALAALDRIAVLRSADLHARRLLKTLDRLAESPPRPAMRSGFDGAAQSVRIAAALIGARG